MASGLPFCTLSSSVPTGPEPAMALSPAFSIVTVSLMERPTRGEAADELRERHARESLCKDL